MTKNLVEIKFAQFFLGGLKAPFSSNGNLFVSQIQMNFLTKLKKKMLDEAQNCRQFS